MNKIFFFVLIFIINNSFGQIIGINGGINTSNHYFSNNYNYYNNFGYQYGIDVRVKLGYDALVLFYKFAYSNSIFSTPNLDIYGLKYRFENNQLLFKRHIVTEIIDVGAGLNWIENSGYNGVDSYTIYKNKKALPNLVFSYGLLSRNKSIGFQYAWNFFFPRKYSNNYSVGKPYGNIFCQELSLLFYPVIKLHRNRKPKEERRRNR